MTILSSARAVAASTAILLGATALTQLPVTANAGSATAAPSVAPQAAAARISSGVSTELPADSERRQLPLGGRMIFPHHVLVAYYGTAHTGSLGVLGENTPRVMTKRLRTAAAPFAQGGKKVQIVYQLIASVADASPGPDGDYSHFIPNSYVREYIRAAKRNKALLVLDLQPGRANFLEQARHFRWALKYPFVGLALDPEWRMGPHQIPARAIGSVRAAEVNRVADFVLGITRANKLPQKLFMLHQFRSDMIRDIGSIRRHPLLAMVQHVDGFGSQGQKLATYHGVARPAQFHMGFKLFYDEDTNMFRPREVFKIRPRVQFISYQ